MQKITVVYSYFGQREMIDRVIREKHPDCRVVIVDDCSPIPLEKIEGLDIYRIDDDIRWNISGARNLGFQESAGWIVNTDMDHLLTFQNVEALLKIDAKEGEVYLLGRIPIREGDKERLMIQSEDGSPILMIHKNDYEKLGGYDEDFAGNYGWDDVLFLMCARKTLKLIERRDIKLNLYEELFVREERDEERNRLILEQKRGEIRNNGTRIRFKWHKI